MGPVAPVSLRISHGPMMNGMASERRTTTTMKMITGIMSELIRGGCCMASIAASSAAWTSPFAAVSFERTSPLHGSFDVRLGDSSPESMYPPICLSDTARAMT